jgi:hypothetical protein
VHQLSTSNNLVFLDLSIDWHVLLFTIVITVTTALLFGVAPTLHASGVAPIDALREHGRGAAGDARAGLASGLVVAQVALSVMLIVASGLFVRTFVSLATRQLGFERDRVLLVNVNVNSKDPDLRRPL